ncbi:MAG: acyl-CoA dehydratase activase [Thermodesulfovibrionales bacterium]
MRILGLDAGSVSVKAAVISEDGTLLKTYYQRHQGHPLRATSDLVKKVCNKIDGIGYFAVTGSAGKVISRNNENPPVNEIVAFATSTQKLLPQVRTIIEMGGEDSKLIILDETGIKDFSMNSVCAAGTGSFLDQQAERLRLTIEEFGEIALRSKNPPKIAGRCSVFAKSDMIHLQQIATPVEDIVSGLCFAVARNFKGSIAKGREIMTPVSFQGGVAANPGVRRAFSEILDIDDLIIPEHFACMGAIGAALKSMGDNTFNTIDLADFDNLARETVYSFSSLKPLVNNTDDFSARHVLKDHMIPPPVNRNNGKAPAFMGIDIGSISTNLAVIDTQGNVLARRYLMTAGRPIEAVLQGLREISEEIRDSLDIKGVGTTGSGRYMIADFVGADIVKNEITAQATAAAFIDPDVDTIFEIGGQDSKYISLEDGVIVDFEMNKACAAGTGSFLEEQAEKLNIQIKREFAECAFGSDTPCHLGERCTVFMGNSLMANLQRGVGKDDLLAGLAYSIVENYMTRVVAGKKVGSNILFQGGVAFNKSVVAAFEKFLDTKIIVPPHHDVTGAIGMALLVRDFVNEFALPQSRFKGFDIYNRKYETSSFECRGCPNVCEINRVKIENEDTKLFYGGRCEKYDINRKKEKTVPDLFAFREEMLWKEHEKRSESSSKTNGTQHKARIGIPYIFLFHDYLPFWTTLLWELGFAVEVSPKTNRQIVNLGVETILAESCFPVKVAHGHIKYLLNKEVDDVLVPSFINIAESDKTASSGVPCPYTQTIPYLASAAFNDDQLLKPVIDYSRGNNYIISEVHEVLKKYGITKFNIKRAIRKAREAQKEFVSAIKDKGKEVLRGLNDRSIVIMGRAYNSFDSGVNLQIPQKLATLDTLAIPMDFLPLDDIDISDKWDNMYWRSGSLILQAARFMKDHSLLYPIFIGNFSCGPDSFILNFLPEELGKKPILHLEIDEHSADAGAITRCEAYLDSIGNKKEENINVKRVFISTKDLPLSLRGRKIYIPRMSDHAFALAAALESTGVEAEVMPETDEEAISIGKRFVSGKECYPCAVTTGDMLKQVSSPDFDAKKSAFFMPSGTGPCRFGQYNVFHRIVLDRFGHTDIPIYSPNQDTAFYRDLDIVGKEFAGRSWDGIIAIELLTKCLHETRPYEMEKGTTEKKYQEYLSRIYEAVRSSNGSLESVMKKMRKDFEDIPKSNKKKPLIGIVGEIFVRSNKFSNDSLVRNIEDLGGEVWVAPFEEWVYYLNHSAKRKALLKKDMSDIINLFLKSFFQKKSERKFARYFEGHLKTLHEPDTKTIISKAIPYIDDSFEGEAILSVGKSIDLAEKGASGIVNAMPFGCMPGTIVTAIMHGVSKKTKVPFISIPYDGTESTTTYLQLEAFMEQTKNKVNDKS